MSQIGIVNGSRVLRADGTVGLGCDCCGSVLCYIRVLPCFCSNDDESRYITSEQAARYWPGYPGTVLEVDGLCYRYMGERFYAEVNVGDIIDIRKAVTHGSCFSSPCAEQDPCPPCSPAVGWFNVGPSAGCDEQIDRLDCVGSVLHVQTGYGTRTTIDTQTGETRFSMRLSYTQIYVDWYTNTGPPRVLATVNLRVNYRDGDRLTANYTTDREVVGDSVDGINRNLYVGNNFLAVGCAIRDFAATYYEAYTGETHPWQGDVGVSEYQYVNCDNPSYSGPGIGYFVIGAEYSYTGSSGGSTAMADISTRFAYEVTTTKMRTSSSHSYNVVGSLNDIPTDDALFERCKYPLIAQACNEDADPQQITYNAIDQPTWATGVRNIANDELYVFTGTPGDPDDIIPVAFEADTCESSEYRVATKCDDETVEISVDMSDAPPDAATVIYQDVPYAITMRTTPSFPVSPVVFSPDACPDGNGIYRINFCGSSGAANQTFTFDPDTNGLRSQTVGYRPGNGLVPGEGHVFIQTPATASGCLTLFAATPTVIPLDTEPEVVLTSMPGTCQGIPSSVIDPRDRCQNIDAGGGGVTPNSPNFTDDSNPAGLGDAVAKGIELLTLGTVKPCTKCEVRKQLLNEFGSRVARAAFKRLGI